MRSGEIACGGRAPSPELVQPFVDLQGQAMPAAIEGGEVPDEAQPVPGQTS